MERYHNFKKFSQQLSIYDIEDMSYEERLKLAKDPNTPPDILYLLLKLEDDDRNIIRNVFNNPNMPLDLILRFVDKSYSDGDIFVNDKELALVDKFERMSSSELERIYENYKGTKYEDIVNRCIVRIHDIPEYIIRELSKDEQSYIRRHIAKNPNTPEDILRELANDENDYVRERVAENPNTPIDVLKQLAKDSKYDVQREAQQALKERGKPEKDKIAEYALDDLEDFMVNADEKDGIAYTYLYYDDIDEIYNNLKEHPDKKLVSLVKNFADIARKYKQEIEEGYERATEEDVEPDEYLPDEVADAFYELFNYFEENYW